MLQIKNLHVHCQEKKILKGISLEVKAGEIHVLMGPNGSGKSTLGRVILGDRKYEKTEGSLQFCGEDFEGMSPSERAQKGFFLSFQSPPELDGVSVQSFFFAVKKALDPEFASSFRLKKELQSTLESLRLPGEFVDRAFNAGFSGGERKKMEVASLLLLNPKLAFLDEIDSGVDIDTLKIMGESLENFTKQAGKGLILVTHSSKLLESISPTHVHILSEGKIVKSGASDLAHQIQKEGFESFIPASNSLKVLS